MGINIIKSLSIPNVMVQLFHNSRNTITSRRVLCTFHETVAGSTPFHDKPYTRFHQKPNIGLTTHNVTDRRQNGQMDLFPRYGIEYSNKAFKLTHFITFPFTIQRDSKRWSQFRTTIFPELYTVWE